MFRLSRVLRRLLSASAAVAAAAAAACAGSSPNTEATPARRTHRAASAAVARAHVPPANPRLPTVPEVDGPLKISVVYPPEGALIASRDSNFVFGSIGNGAAGLTINGTLVPVWPNGAFMGWLPVPRVGAQWYDITAYTAADTVRARYPVRTLAAVPPRAAAQPDVTPVSPAAPAVLIGAPPSAAASDTDNVVIGRPTPTGTYRWFLFPGTPVSVTEYRGDMARVQLDADQEVWVSRSDVTADVAAVGGSGSTTPLAIGSPRIRASTEAVTFQLSLPRPPAYLVDEDERTLTVTLYNTAEGSGSVPAVHDPLLSHVTRSRDGMRTVYRFDLTHPVYGYLALYHDGVFSFVIRRPPTVNAAAPLRGMTIVVDPGHPPIGATGPTGLWEPVPTLAVGLRVRDMLRRKGAHVVMTRTSPAPVALTDRPILARRADANALVSIHLNADADGSNPFRTNGTGTYYFHPHSRLLAADIQKALVPQLGLRDRGVIFQNLALARPTWFPAVLAEGLFIIMPEQEAAIRTAKYQDAYALGIVNGLERFFSTFAK